jgi:signal transduction histidine kinase
VGGAEPVTLADVAVERADAWSALFAERGLHLDAARADGAVVHVGVGRLAQVLDNLLSNALEASPLGGTVRAWADGGTVHVADEGPGLSAEERERAFDRFWHARPGPGSGLGLPIARRLVEAGGATLELRDAASGGVEAVVAYEPAGVRPVRVLQFGPRWR